MKFNRNLTAPLAPFPNCFQEKESSTSSILRIFTVPYFVFGSNLKDFWWVSFCVLRGFRVLPVAKSILLKQRLNLRPFFCRVLLFLADNLSKQPFDLSPPMACSLKAGLSVSRLKDNFRSSKSSVVSGFRTSSLKGSKQKGFPILRVDFLGKSVVISDQNSGRNSNPKAPNGRTINARVQRWWEKTLKPNMVEIRSAQALVDALLDAGDRLAIIDFYSPGCGGCKALHPKICQLAELNPDAIFLKVNLEALRTMCQALGIRVLPFFRFYRGAEGRVCSFSCTNSTIKKFKDALVKHGTDRCSILPVKGLDESELERLAKAGEISLDSPPSPCLNEGTLKNLYSYGSWGTSGNKWELLEENNLILKV